MSGIRSAVAGALLAVLVVATPASSATGTFTSSTTTPAVTGTSSSGASTAKGVFGVASSSTGTVTGVYGRSSSSQGRGVIGYAPATSGSAIGVYGQSNAAFGRGIFGYAPSTSAGAVGVMGQSTAGVGVLGIGVMGVVSSGNLGTDAHILADTTDDVLGVCTVPSGSTNVSCSFGHSFPPSGGGNPIVTLTPTSNPGSSYWISATSLTGFSITMASAPSNPVSFNFIVIGFLQ